MSPDPTRRSDRSQRAILDATTELLVEVGFVRLTIEAIAARAGVGKQTIYRWWPSKGAVVFDALLRGNAGEDDGPLLPNTGDLAADLRSMLEGSIEELTHPQQGPLLRTITAEVQHDPVLAEELLDRLLRPLYDASVERIRAGQEAGQVDADLDARVIMETLYGAVFHRWLLRTVPFEDDYLDRLLAVVLGPQR